MNNCTMLIFYFLFFIFFDILNFISEFILGKNVIKKRMYTTMSLIQKSLETVQVFNNRELDMKIIIDLDYYVIIIKNNCRYS